MSRRRRLPSVTEVLNGRARPDFATLVRLIHAVNPTERGLDPATERARYLEKAALQSVLIRGWPDQVGVVAHGGPGVVLLTVGGGRDAGHARVAALDLAARAWVRRQLDTARFTDPSVAPPPAPPAEPPPASALARGRAALAEYDFAAAEALFEEAVGAHPDDVGAAAALLELWVDTLMADAKALALGDGLPVALQNDRAIRGFLAVAAARAGRLRLARRWLEGGEGPRAGEAWVWLARAAVRSEDLLAARRAVATLGRIWPAAPALPELQDATAVLAARLRAPAEEALLAAEAAGAALEVLEARARRLLEVHSESPAATRVLRRADERRRDGRLARLRAEAEAAEAAGRFGVAASLFREALELGDPVGEALARVSARAAVDRRRARVEAVSRRLRGPDEEALLAWLALEPAERAEVEAALPELVWLAQLDPPSGGPAAREAARAVRALARARALMTEAPGTARALVEPHRALLGPLPDAARLFALADEALHLDRAARQRALLDAAAALLDAGDAEAAGARLVNLHLEALDAPGRARAATLERWARLLEELALADEPIARRPLLAALAELDGRRREALAAVDAAVARAWGRRIWTAVDAPPAALFSAGTRMDARVWVSGEAVVIPDLHGRWLFLRWVQAGRVSRAVRWRLPRAARLLDFVVDGAGLRVLTDGRAVYTFSADGGTALRADEAPGARAETGVLVPDTAFVWTADGDTIEVFDMERGVCARRLLVTEVPGLGTVPGPDGARVVVRAADLRVHAADGAPLEAVPTADGVIAGRDGWRAVGPRPALPALDTQGIREGCAVGRRDGAVFQLRAIHLWAGDLTWSLSVPAASELVRDAAGDRVAVVVPDPGGLRICPLDPDRAPALELTPIWRPGEALQPWRVAATRGLPRARLPEVMAAREIFGRRAPVEWLAEARRLHGAWADAICAEAIRPENPEAARTVAATAARAWPHSGVAGLLLAEDAIASGRWVAARAALEGRTPEPGAEGWYARVLGFARLYTGAAAGAVAAWQAGLAAAPEARELLERLIAAVGPALEPGSVTEAPSVYAAFVRALAQAEACRCAGDLPGAVDALDHPWTWHFAELQTLARMAEVLLEIPPQSQAEALRTQHALAVCVAAAEGTLDLGPERRITVPLAADKWTAARIEAVAERARAFLDQP